MELEPDFLDLLEALRSAGADFLIVGGYAVAFYGHVRATKDLDILVRPSPENATRVYRALAEFGAPLAAFEVREEDFCNYEGVLQLGLPPVRIDIINRIDGVSFDEAFEHRSMVELSGQGYPVIGREALLKNKAASGRPQDLADLAILQAQG